MKELTHDQISDILTSAMSAELRQQSEIYKQQVRNFEALILQFLQKIEDPILKDLYTKHFKITTQHEGRTT